MIQGRGGSVSVWPRRVVVGGWDFEVFKRNKKRKESSKRNTIAKCNYNIAS